MRWSRKLTYEMLTAETKYQAKSLTPEILIPIPEKAINKLFILLSTKDFELYGFRLLFHYSLKHITDDHYTPFGAFMFWSSADIRKVLGKGRDVGKLIFNTLFDTENHSEGNFPRSYRYKPEYLEDGFMLVPSNIELNESLPRIWKGRGINPQCKASFSFIRGLDFSEVNLFNPLLLMDFISSAESSFSDSLGKRTNKNNISIRRFYLRNKTNFKMRPLKLCYGGHVHYELLEEELIYQRKKYYLNKFKGSGIPNRDNVTNRLHHILTNIPGECIYYISFQNEKLIEIDMSNCHYTLFANILVGYMANEFNDLLNNSKTYNELMDFLDGKSIRDIINSTLNIIKGGNQQQPPALLIKLAPFLRMKVGKYSDIFLFIIAAIKGQLYEVIGMRLYGEGYSPNMRNRIKSILMGVFYGYFNDPHGSSDFEKAFPNLFDLITDLKAHLYRSFKSNDIKSHDFYSGCIESQEKKDKTDYKAGNSCLPILLMKVESRIFVDKLLYPLQYMGFDVITKHDSILVKESDYDAVHEVVIQLLDDEFGEGMFHMKGN